MLGVSATCALVEVKKLTTWCWYDVNKKLGVLQHVWRVKITAGVGAKRGSGSVVEQIISELSVRVHKTFEGSF